MIKGSWVYMDSSAYYYLRITPEPWDWSPKIVSPLHSPEPIERLRGAFSSRFFQRYSEYDCQRNLANCHEVV